MVAKFAPSDKIKMQKKQNSYVTLEFNGFNNWKGLYADLNINTKNRMNKDRKQYV
jgi:hypothetical protein